jgi:hypothetical protein
VGCFKDSLSLLEYCTFEDHSRETVMLEERFREAQTLLGIQKIYIVSFMPPNTKLEVFPEAEVFSVTHIPHMQDEQYQVEDTGGPETCKCDRKLWLACLLQVNDSEVQHFCIHLASINLSCLCHYLQL